MSYGIILPKPPRFRDVPQFIQAAPYAVDVPWDYLQTHIDHEKERGKKGIDLDPDFQRGHVWTMDKRQGYIEFCLRGGESARNVYLNCPGFMSGNRDGDFVLVDGKQRITTILMFLRNEVEVFGGHVFSNFSDRLTLTGPSVRWHVNNLKTRAEVLQWYLDLNTGGVVHTTKEIEKVKHLLEKETGK